LLSSVAPISGGGEKNEPIFAVMRGDFRGRGASRVEAAHASCAVPTAEYQGGAYGAYAVTAGGCFVGVYQYGGTGVTTAAASSSFIGGDGTSYSLSSSADLGTGALTLNSPTGISSASIWDTFTYTDCRPAGRRLRRRSLCPER
jgi:hypothetical protein